MVAILFNSFQPQWFTISFAASSDLFDDEIKFETELIIW